MKYIPIRTFYNVGDALFTVENINGKYFIYDCGAQSNSDAEEVILKAFPKEGQSIEAVFISHYDKDHINGIHFLLKHCNVKILILPLFSKFNILLSYSNLIKRIDVSDNDIYFFLDTVNYINQFSSQTRLIYIDSNNIENDNNLTNITFDDLDIDDNNNFSTNKTFSSGIKMHLERNSDWVFIIHNIQTLTSEEEKKFKDRFSSLCFEAGVADGDIKALWEKQELCLDKDNKLKKAIQEFIASLRGHDINSLSLTVYSGPYKVKTRSRLGCLYTGDYNTKKYFSNLHYAYNLVWKYIGVVQVPHHGSWHNYNEKLLKEDVLAVVSLKLPLTTININRRKTFKKIVEQNAILLPTGYYGDITLLHNYPSLSTD